MYREPLFVVLDSTSSLATHLMSDLKTRIADDMKTALKAKQGARLTAIRLLRAAIQRREVDDRTELDDTSVLAIIQKLVKQSQDSIEQFSNAGRDDLVNKEQLDLDVFQHYLPAALDDDEISAIIDTAISEAGASSMRDMGQVMKIVGAKVQGRGDMGKISAMVKQQLQT